MKKVSLRKDEEEGDDNVKHPQMKSRRFSINSMFMGAMGRSIPDKIFDGRILLKRVSKTHVVKKE